MTSIAGPGLIIRVHLWFHCFEAEAPLSPVRVASMPAKVEPQIHTDAHRSDRAVEAGWVDIKEINSDGLVQVPQFAIGYPTPSSRTPGWKCA
jgi:hypothetical protein